MTGNVSILRTLFWVEHGLDVINKNIITCSRLKTYTILLTTKKISRNQEFKSLAIFRVVTN